MSEDPVPAQSAPAGATRSSGVAGGRQSPEEPRWVRRLWGWLTVRPPFGEPARVQDAVVMLLLYGTAIAVWCGALTPIEFALGVPMKGIEGISSGPNYRDALWHLGTGLLVALPLRNRALLILMPLLSLGLDSDHAFAAIFPTPLSREAHNLIFFGLVTVVLLRLGGRFLGGAVASSWLIHIAVDGGDFPLFAPFTPAEFTLSYPMVVLMVAAATAAAYLAVRPAELPRSARDWVPVVAMFVGVSVALYWLAPIFVPFTTW